MELSEELLNYIYIALECAVTVSSTFKGLVYYVKKKTFSQRIVLEIDFKFPSFHSK